MADRRISKGQNFNFYKRLGVSNTTFGVASSDFREDILVPFSTQGFQILNEETAANKVVEYSFDGFNVHGEINPTMPNRLSVFQNRIACKVWFRIKSGSVANVVIAFEAWGRT